jgi:hypothetical protein
LDFFLELILGSEQLEARALAKAKEINARQGSSLTLNPSDRHTTAHQSIFLRGKLSVGVSSDEQINVQRWFGGDFLRFFQALMQNCEKEFRLAPRAVRGADELAAAAGD